MTAITPQNQDLPISSTQQHTLQERLQHAIESVEIEQIYPSSAARLILMQLNIDSLSNEKKLELYSIINSGIFPFFNEHQDIKLFCLFEIRDQLLRVVHNNSNQEFVSYCRSSTFPFVTELVQDIETTSLRGLNTHQMIARTSDAGTQSLENFDLVVDSSRRTDASENTRSFKRILLSTIEYEGAQCGGVGSSVRTMSKYMSENTNHDVRVITPFYDVYINDYPRAKFVTTISHFWQGRFITSSIYKVSSQGGTVPQYLIKPSLSLMKNFEINGRTNIYTDPNYIQSACENRYGIFSSAFSVFAGCYSGRKRQKSFDCIHNHCVWLTLVHKILRSTINTKRSLNGLSSISLIQHLHGGSHVGEQGGIFKSDFYTKLGLNSPKSVNLQLEAYRNADAIVHVSEAVAHMATEKETAHGMDSIANVLKNQGRLHAVSNGVLIDRFNVCDQTVLGRYAFTQSNGSIQFLEGRQRIMRDLHNASLLPHPTKPLFTFVGRFSTVKGIDVLPRIAEAIHERGGQIVVMGSFFDNDHCRQIIHTVEELASQYPESIKVITTREEQMELFNDTGIQKGFLIRAASTFSVVPSHNEADGIVPKEFWATGAICLTSAKEGIADNAVDIENTNSANAVTYHDNHNYLNNATTAVDRAMRFYHDKSESERNAIANRIANSARDKFTWQRSCEKLLRIYTQAQTRLTQEQLNERQKAYERFMNKEKKITTRIGRIVSSIIHARIWKKIIANLFYYSRIIGDAIKSASHKMLPLRKWRWIVIQ